MTGKAAWLLSALSKTLLQKCTYYYTYYMYKYPYLLSDFCSHEEQIVFGHIWKPYNMHTHISTTIPILVYIHTYTKVSISIIFCRYANMTFIWLILPLVLVSSIGECSRSKRDAKLLVNSGEQDCHNSWKRKWNWKNACTHTHTAHTAALSRRFFCNF